MSRLQQGPDARTFYDRTNSTMCRSINQHDINKVYDERFLLYKVLLSKLFVTHVRVTYDLPKYSKIISINMLIKIE